MDIVPVIVLKEVIVLIKVIVKVIVKLLNFYVTYDGSCLSSSDSGLSRSLAISSDLFPPTFNPLS